MQIVVISIRQTSMKPFTPEDYDNTVISIAGLYKSFGANHVLRGVDLEAAIKGKISWCRDVPARARAKACWIKIIAGLLEA